MDAGKPTTLKTILDALRAKLVTVTGIAQEYIIPTLSEDWFTPGGLADQFILLSKFAGQEVSSVTDGAGVAGKMWNATLDLVLLSRLDTDFAGGDYNRLADASYGLLAKWGDILVAMEQWMPDDGGSPAWGLLAQPARTFGFQIAPRSFKAASGWVQIRTKLHIPFIQQLS